MDNVPLADEDVTELKAKRDQILEELCALTSQIELLEQQDCTRCENEGTRVSPVSAPLPYSPSPTPPTSIHSIRSRRKRLRDQLSSLEIALAPQKRLPAELLSQVFIAAHSEASSIPPEKRGSPLVLCHVCSRWRQVALNTAELWTDVVLRLTEYTRLEPPDAIDVAREWFARSDANTHKLLSLAIVNQLPASTTKWEDEGLGEILKAKVIAPFSGRWRSLQIQMPDNELDRLRLSRISFPELRAISLKAWPSKAPGDDPRQDGFSHMSIRFRKETVPLLSSVELLDFGHLLSPPSLPWTKLTHLNLRRTRNDLYAALRILADTRILEECELSVKVTHAAASDSLLVRILLPRLRIFAVDFVREDSLVPTAGVGTFFEPLFAPNLRSLSVRSVVGYVNWPLDGTMWGMPGFLKFLNQSDCQLEILHLELPFNPSLPTPGASPEIQVIASLLPTLVELRLSLEESGAIPPTFLRALGEGILLPRLTILVGCVEELSEVLDMLEARIALQGREGMVGGLEATSSLECVMVDYLSGNITQAQARKIDALRERGVRLEVTRSG